MEPPNHQLFHIFLNLSSSQKQFQFGESFPFFFYLLPFCTAVFHPISENESDVKILNLNYLQQTRMFVLGGSILILLICIWTYDKFLLKHSFTIMEITEYWLILQYKWCLCMFFFWTITMIKSAKRPQKTKKKKISFCNFWHFLCLLSICLIFLDTTKDHNFRLNFWWIPF